ncbi:DUF1385 domain-containing protein [Candidatus Poribacteria bacterium]|nr:DUF1385 domain-containing protein [Candidatus Poribacteria bacterium]
MSKLRIGGQAVIEGVMMRGKHAFSIVVQKPNGELVVHKEKLNNPFERYPFLKLPVLRGCVALFENLILGIKALSFSAEQFMQEEDTAANNPTDKKNSSDKNSSSNKMSTIEMAGTMAISFGVGFLLFFMLPLMMTNFVKSYFDVLNHGLLFNFIDGLFRIGIFVTYIYTISQIKDVARVFQYHGAEHKAVFNFESGDSLSVEHAEKYSPLHPRCGTSFLLFVMMISIIVLSFVPREISIIEKALFRLVLIPLIVGISYELIKFSGDKASNPIINILIKPGMLLQKLTTREPTSDQLNVAIKAIEELLTLENPEKIS